MERTLRFARLCPFASPPNRCHPDPRRPDKVYPTRSSPANLHLRVGLIHQVTRGVDIPAPIDILQNQHLAIMAARAFHRSSSQIKVLRIVADTIVDMMRFGVHNS
ncbi:hypothetical protein Bbelb_028660 [Branchiostoma belcheri]|nr:hypothetical protein Bbelb_028660 [Branchiostoma belcheri]